MKMSEPQSALRIAVHAARTAGAIMSQNAHAPKRIHAATQHDIKLELDVRCQRRIESVLRRAFPEVAILGEEGVVGDPASEHRWVVDPIDGTVNFTYGIPHACVSIALQGRRPKPRSSRREEALTPICNLQSALRNRREPPHVGCSSRERGSKSQPASDADYETLVGVVFDPFCDELFTAVRGQAAKVNGRQVRVSSRRRLDEAIISVGFAKTRASLNQMLPGFKRLVHRVRKIRIMGAAALSLAYVAAGRMDAYVESGLRLWDIAAGGLLIECAGGDFFHEPVAGGRHTYRILANNGLLRKPLAKLV